MNIHEHQAKEILKKYGAIVPEGVFAFTVEDLIETYNYNLSLNIMDFKKL
jgi:succinyl-CoA synthetase beta subunit